MHRQNGVEDSMSITDSDGRRGASGKTGECNPIPAATWAPFAETVLEIRHRREHRRLMEVLSLQAGDDLGLDQDERDTAAAAALTLERADHDLGRDADCDACSQVSAAIGELDERSRERRRSARLEEEQSQCERVRIMHQQDQLATRRVQARCVVGLLLTGSWWMAHERDWPLPGGWLMTAATLAVAVGVYLRCESVLLRGWEERFPLPDPSPQVLRRWLRARHREGRNLHLCWPGGDDTPAAVAAHGPAQPATTRVTLPE